MITKRKADIIVNVVNSYLKLGGGISWATVRNEGKIIRKESDATVGIFGFPKDQCVKILISESKFYSKKSASLP